MNIMKAFVRVDAISLEIKLENVPIPKIQSDEVLIKVGAFGVGIHDRYFIPTGIDFPYIIGIEGSGEIVELGDEISGFVLGNRVVFTTVLQPLGGCWAEYAVAKKDALIHLPDNLTFAQGAAVSIAGKTAIECMTALGLNKGDKLFIAGASGAIGTFVIQLATNLGIQVAASASAKNQTYMQSLGALKTVDYNDTSWMNSINEWSNGGVCAALAIQPGTGIDSIKVVKNDGKLITVSGDNEKIVPERNINIQQMGHNKDIQLKLVGLIQDISNGKNKLVIEKIYDFEEALEALKKTETRHAQGKLVVKL